MEKRNTLIMRWWDLPAAALLLAALLISASRLIATGWTTDLNVTQILIALGVIAGLALGKSRFSPRVVAFFAFAYGLFFVLWRLGTTIQEDLLWIERLSMLSNRLGIIIFQLFNQEPVKDSLLFLTLMSILYWVLGVYAGYTLVRYGNAWKAIIPAGLTLFVIHSFDPLISQRTWYLAAFIFFALVLIARMNFLYRQNNWQQNRTALPPHLGFDFVRFAVVAAMVIVLFAWTAPALASALPAAQKAWQPVKNAWDDTKNNFENAFASLRSTMGYVSEVYGVSASLGVGNPLSQRIIFIAEPQETVPVGVRLYWRARTYDNYNNGRWVSTINETHDFYPQQEALYTPAEIGRWTSTFKFISQTTPGTLFVPPQPLWVDRPGQVEYTEYPDGTLDISNFRAIPGLRPGQEYIVSASLSNATIAELRESGDDYPEWITERYLQLPDNITPRTHRLAEIITTGLDNPYDKVAAITSYLRENITYVDTLSEAPPNDQEIVDWFLFEYQQGFCNYYSTAEVVLLRSIGIPARWSIGYARGESMAESGNPNAYLVRHFDAHAWPEVYFNGIGWVEFEPTVSQPNISRLSGDSIEELNPDFADRDFSQQLRDEIDKELEEIYLGGQGSEGESGTQLLSMNLLYWLLALSLGAGLVFLGWRMRPMLNFHAAPIFLEKTFTKFGIRPPESLRNWARWAVLPQLSKSYLEINNALKRLGAKPVVNHTPSERAVNLSLVLPNAHKPAHDLVKEYEVAIFSKQPADLTVAQNAGKEIRLMSIKAYFQRWLTRLQQRPGSSRRRKSI